jgi:hypothetical protein
VRERKVDVEGRWRMLLLEMLEGVDQLKMKSDEERKWIFDDNT